MSPEDADRMTNSVDPDQTAPLEQSDLGIHCLPRPVCPKTWHDYGSENLDTCKAAVIILYFE